MKTIVVNGEYNYICESCGMETKNHFFVLNHNCDCNKTCKKCKYNNYYFCVKNKILMQNMKGTCKSFKRKEGV